jgi:hypothetical protein
MQCRRNPEAGSGRLPQRCRHARQHLRAGAEKLADSAHRKRNMWRAGDTFAGPDVAKGQSQSALA